MATYASLSEEDKALVGAFERDFRGWFNDLARGIIAARALEAHYIAGGGPGSIIATLDTGEFIPNTGGLNGAQALEQDTDFAALISGMSTFLTTYDTIATRQRIAQAVGPTAGL